MLKKIRSLGLNSSFIEIYDNAFSQKECDILIDQFEKSEIVEGGTTSGYRPEEKQCRQIDNPHFPEIKLLEQMFFDQPFIVSTNRIVIFLFQA